MTDDRDLERLLRSALDAEARRMEPAGDGLAKIRTRVQKKHGWAKWWKPTLALVGAAAVGAAVVAAPSYLTASGNDKPGLADPAAPGSSVPLSPPVSPTNPTPSGSWGPGIGGDSNLPDRIAIWPYPSRKAGYEKADGDVTSGKYPHLADAAQTAIDFVASFVGTKQELTATRLGPAGPGVAMVVNRKDPDNGALTPVSNIFLVRVRPADDAPYVVIAATRNSLGDSLTMSALPKVSGTTPFVVGGSVKRDADAAGATVKVSLREPGSSEDLGLGTVTAKPSPAGDQTWSVRLSPFQPLRTSGVVAAWTIDSSGNVVEFVAAPVLP